MRKLAPAFLLSSIVALSCGSAFALGDMNKSKKSPSASVSTTAPADAKAPADVTYPAATPNATSPATAGDTNRGPGAAASGSTTNGAPMSNSVSSNGSTMATEGMATDKSNKWSAKDCQGLALTDPKYKSNNCRAADSTGGN